MKQISRMKRLDELFLVFINSFNIYVVGDLENSAVCNLPKTYCKMPADYENGLKLYNQSDLFQADCKLSNRC